MVRQFAPHQWALIIASLASTFAGCGLDERDPAENLAADADGLYDDEDEEGDTAASVDGAEVTIGTTTEAVVFADGQGQRDDRQTMSDAWFRARPRMWAFGLLEVPGGICSATLIARHVILTAGHCLTSDVAPASLVFRPAFVGPLTAANRAQRPSARGLRYVDANLPPYGQGNDWAIVELDPNSYQRGNRPAGSAIPVFPATLAEYQTIPVGSLSNPVPAAGIVVTAFGYSADFFTARGTPGRHESCRLVGDAVCSDVPGQRATGDGPVMTNCDWTGGASGGPSIVDPYGANPRIVAIHGGGLQNGPVPYNEANANRDISVNGMIWAPHRAAGFTATASGTGQLLGFASDSFYNFGGRFARLDSADGIRPADRWNTFRTGLPVGVMTRMASATTPDRHAWVFAIVGGQLWNRFEQAPGAWGDWQTFFAGSAMSSDLIDIEARAAGRTAMQVYTLHSDGTIRTRRKLDRWNGLWDGISEVGRVVGARSLAASHAHGAQTLFAITASRIYAYNETGASTNRWSNRVDMTAGLPADVQLIDVTAGQANGGVMDVYVLARSGGATRIYRRARVNNLANAAWGNWALLDSHPRLSGASQIEVTARSAVTGFAPRLIVVKDGQLLTRHYDAAGRADGWPGLYTPAQVACP